MRWRAVSLIGLLGVLVGCAPSADGGVAGPVAANTQRSAEQEAALADGDVTLDEYRAGFRRFQACLEAEGYALADVVVGDVLVDYGVPATAVDAGVDERCYVEEYELVDTEWQVKNEDTSYTAEVAAQCLVDHGVAPAETLAEKWEQLEAAGVDFADCL